MTIDTSKLLGVARLALSADAKGGALVDRERILATVSAYSALAAPGIDDSGILAVVEDLEKIFNVWSGRAGVLLGNDPSHREWLSGRHENIAWRFWNRYRAYVEDRFPPQVIEEMNIVTDDVLGWLEDPLRDGSWRRQGLVVGHVQSGKTANYIGLICKAADSGYKVVVVLSGIHNSLRAQTQTRLDEGFLGYARPFDDSQRHGAPIGVGLIDPTVIGDTVTTRDERGDFSKAKAAGFQIHAGGNVLLFVVKKHATVLANLIQWAQLSAKQVGPGGTKTVAGIPLLVIDDEADQASIDTNFQPVDEDGNPDPDHDPTKINQLIRSLLMTFEKCAYVGYTATPFANVFIHHKAQLDKFGPDLFPRDFIVNLTTPSDYFGPVRVFGLEGSNLPERGHATSRIRFIDDASEWVPPTHKNTLVPRYGGLDHVPPSLERAIKSFILASAARRARGQETKHKSMLIHVTRFTKVQELVHRQVSRLVDDYKVRWRAREVSVTDTLLKDIRDLWNEDFVATSAAHGESAPAWELVESQVWQVLSQVKVNLINAKASDALIYEEYADTGLNVIAIGGDKLSRGLTLEGLTVSYFLRASRMYDTLMQMGRWFGYRPGYEDLCRLYLSEDLAEWYAHITEASEALRAEFDRMVLVGGTPMDYGFRVQTHPELAITGKLRPGLREMTTSLSATPFEPTILREDAIVENWATTRSFLETLGRTGNAGFRADDEGLPERRGTWPGSVVWREVAGDSVLAFIQKFKFADNELTRTSSRVVLDYINQRRQEGELDNWTVAVLGKTADSDREADEIQFTLPRTDHKLMTLLRRRSGTRRQGLFVVKRVGSPKDESLDLTRAEWEKVLAFKSSLPAQPDGVKEWTSGRLIREARPKERGLLILYALTPTDAPEGEHASVPMIAPYISFPYSAGARAVTYKLTELFWERELGGVE